jgi:predicted TIM-barrel fold metal-dependent hydrolase
MARVKPFFVVDFHAHHVPKSFALTTTLHAPPDQQQRWESINRRLADETALVAAIDSGDLDARVVSVPSAMIADADGNVPDGSVRRINDSIAELVGRHQGRLHGLATIDPFAGDEAAAETERAVRGLGLRGIFVDSAKGELLIDAPQARPALRTAARLGVPVFVHPINPQPLSRQLAPYGRLGTSFSRGTINGAAVVALLEGGVFEELPDLQVVITALGFGGIALAAAFGHHGRWSESVTDVLRRHVHIDTMGFHPALIRAAIELLGPERVLVGTDWPIVGEGPSRSAIKKALAAAGLTEGQRRLVAGVNSLRLIGRSPETASESRLVPALVYLSAASVGEPIARERRWKPTPAAAEKRRNWETTIEPASAVRRRRPKRVHSSLPQS